MSNRLKLKVRTKIPAALLGGIGTVITKDGITYKVELDYSTLQDVGSTFDPNYVVVAIWNPHTGDWARVSLTNFLNGSISPAVFDIIAPTTTEGDMIVREGGHNVRLPVGPNGYALISNGTDPVYAGFLESGTGAAPRAWQDKGRDTVSVKGFGAIGDGTRHTVQEWIVPGALARYPTLAALQVDYPHVTATTDGIDWAAMQAAHNTGKLIKYPQGTYVTDDGKTVTIASGGIIGDGPTLTTIMTTNTALTNSLFKFTGALGSYTNVSLFHGFTLSCPVGKSGGAGIQVLPASGEASYLDFRNIHTNNLPIGIDFVAASLWKVIGCDFLGYTLVGVQVANTNVSDSGDGVISGCVFNTPGTVGSGVWQKSSGGLKIIGNKFLGGQRAYTMNIEGTTSVLIIAGNSMENMAGACLSFAQGVATKSFHNVIISDNEFAVGTKAIETDGTVGFLSTVNVTGNLFNMSAGGSNAVTAFVNVPELFVSGNLIKGNGGAGSSAITVATCTGRIGRNLYLNLPNPLSVTTSPSLAIDKDIQVGTVTSSTSGWSAYGTLFSSANITVTFPTAFLIAPSISDFSAAGSSGAGETGFIVISISATQCVFRVISAVTGVAATMNWRCTGVL